VIKAYDGAGSQVNEALDNFEVGEEKDKKDLENQMGALLRQTRVLSCYRHQHTSRRLHFKQERQHTEVHKAVREGLAQNQN
jgi:hypothetical protein